MIYFAVMVDKQAIFHTTIIVPVERKRNGVINT